MIIGQADFTVDIDVGSNMVTDSPEFPCVNIENSLREPGVS